MDGAQYELSPIYIDGVVSQTSNRQTQGAPPQPGYDQNYGYDTSRPAYEANESAVQVDISGSSPSRPAPPPNKPSRPAGSRAAALAALSGATKRPPKPPPPPKSRRDPPAGYGKDSCGDSFLSETEDRPHGESFASCGTSTMSYIHDDEDDYEKGGKRGGRRRSWRRSSLDDDDDVSRGPCGLMQLSAGRVFLSLFAVGLIWCTSLSVVLAYLRGPPEVIPTPVFQEVVIPQVDIVLNTTTKLRTEYIECVAESLTSCNYTLQAALQSEVYNVLALQADNVATVQEAQTAAYACTSNHILTFATIDVWLGARVDFTDPYLPTCPDRPRLEALTGDLGSEKNQTLSIAVSYASQSDSAIALLADQIKARREYDQQYLINKTGLLDISADLRLALLTNFSLNMGINFGLGNLNISNLLACASLQPGNGPCPGGDGLYDAVLAAQQGLYDGYDTAQQTYVATAETAAAYAEQAEATVKQATDVLDSLQGILFSGPTPLLGEYGGFTGLPGFPGGACCNSQCTAGCFPLGDLTGAINLCGTTVPSPSGPAPPPCFWEQPAFSGDLGDLCPPGSACATSIDAFRDLQVQALQNLNLSAYELNAAIAAIDANIGFDDYNPPDICASCVQEAQENRTAAFKDDVADSLDDLDLEDAASDQLNSTASFIDFTLSGLKKSSQNLAWFRTFDYTNPGIDFDGLFDYFDYITGVAISFDIAYRILQSISVMLKFWGRSALPVMPVDVTTDRESKLRGKSMLNGLQSIVLKLTSGPVLGLVAAIFIVLVLTVVWAIYKPVFDSYYEGCVATEIVNGREVNSGSETMLSRNAYAIAYNYAVSQGNRDRLAGFDNYEEARTTSCNANFQLSQQTQNNAQAQLNDAKVAHALVEVDLQLMRDCYNVPLIQGQLDALGLGAPSTDLYALLHAPQCTKDVANMTLVDATFNCESLPECEMGCDSLADADGNDNSLLKPTVHGACCTLEWWGHSFILKISFAIVIYLCLNLFRVLSMMGLNRLLWESLNTGWFSFLGTTDVDGGAQHDEDTLAKKLADLLRTIKLKGLLLVTLACTAQVPWIIALVYIVPRVAYEVLS